MKRLMTTPFYGFSLMRDTAGGFSAYDVILLNGLPQSSDGIVFNPVTYHFTTSDGTDITNLITRADKLSLVPNFDITKDNIRLSNESYAKKPTAYTGLDELNTNVASLFVSNVDQTLNNLGTGVGAAVTSTVQTAVIFGIAGLVAYLLLSKK